MSGEHTHPEVAALALRVTELEAALAAVNPSRTWSSYSGKPDGTIVIPNGDYVRLDVNTDDPPIAGLEWHLLYANCVLRWNPNAAEQVGVIRVKYVREGGDATAFQDFTVTGYAIGNPDSFLITHMHMENGEAGIGGRWWVRCAGALESIEVGTRYCKTDVVT